MEREIRFYYENKDKQISITTDKTNKEIVEILNNYDYFVNIDSKGVLSCVNLKQVKFIEIKKNGE